MSNQVTKVFSDMSDEELVMVIQEMKEDGPQGIVPCPDRQRPPQPPQRQPPDRQGSASPHSQSGQSHWERRDAQSP